MQGEEKGASSDEAVFYKKKKKETEGQRGEKIKTLMLENGKAHWVVLPTASSTSAQHQ